MALFYYSGTRQAKNGSEQLHQATIAELMEL